MKRLQMAFEGINEPISADKCQHFNGLYTLIRTNIEAEQRRTYQIIKLLITLSNKYIRKNYLYFLLFSPIQNYFCSVFLEVAIVKIIFH